VNSAAVESVYGNSALVLVSATSRVTNSPGGKDEPPRMWRLKVTVSEVNGQYKMSKVEYVP
jgi:Mce-associated membrane protein